MSHAVRLFNTRSSRFFSFVCLLFIIIIICISLQIKPTGSTIFKVFVRYGQRPTVTEYDSERKVPDGKCSLNSQRRCDDAAYDFLLVDSVLGKPGSYYIGILYDKSEQETIRKRKRRSCVGKRRQKRSCVEFKDPPKPGNITLIPVYDPKTDVNYSMNVEEEECLFWNRTEEKWHSNGCKVRSSRTLNQWSGLSTLYKQVTFIACEVQCLSETRDTREGHYALFAHIECPSRELSLLAPGPLAKSRPCGIIVVCFCPMLHLRFSFNSKVLLCWNWSPA